MFQRFNGFTFLVFQDETGAAPYLAVEKFPGTGPHARLSAPSERSRPPIAPPWPGVGFNHERDEIYEKNAIRFIRSDHWNS